ncbi:cupin domain-containing protein [Rugosimonospora africana]|uniref:cupin domain-containing protein n=1 Tax=Rugosimonospora africana TaxID=556532 RepID=UPI003570BBFC
MRRCVAVEPEAFAGTYWGRAPLHCRAADFAAARSAAPGSAPAGSTPPGAAPAGSIPAGSTPAGSAPAGSAPAAARPPGFGDLFGTGDADELLSRRGLRTPFLRVVRDGEVLPAHSYVGPGGAGAEVGDQVRDERILALFAHGATLVFQGLHRLWPPLIDFAGTLAAELSVPVGVNAYLTPAGSRGFASHYDTHDVFVLQVEGRKRWMIHEPVLDDPLERQPHGGRRDEVAATAAGPPALEVELAAGDTLYLPRGWLHSATALGGPSLHLTLGLRALTRYALVEELLALAAEEPALRAGFPLGFDPTDENQLAGQLAGTVAALREALREPDVAAVARRMRSRTWPTSRPAPIRPLAQAAASEAVDPDTIVTPRAGLRWFLRTEPDAAILELPDRTIRFPAFCGPAVLAVLDAAGPVRVGDLPDLDGEDQVVLVRRLLREAVAVPARSA